MATKQESWLVKNMFSLIALLITISGFIAGYTKLKLTVDNMQSSHIDKELIRTISKDIFKEQIVLIEKDIKYIQTDIKRNQDTIKVLFRIKAKSKGVSK